MGEPFLGRRRAKKVALPRKRGHQMSDVPAKPISSNRKARTPVTYEFAGENKLQDGDCSSFYYLGLQNYVYTG
jgi:hypothetical protein